MSSLAERTEAVSLEHYRKNNFNVLVPTATMVQISPFHRIRTEEVKIDPNPDAGDVFKVGSKKAGEDAKGKAIFEDVLSLSKNALMKISNAAGIVWNWSETKVISATRDYVLYQAVGAFRKPSGEWLPLKASKEIDLTIVEEETFEANLEKGKKLAASTYDSDKKKLDGMTAEQWAAAQTKSNMIQWRKNKLMRAETGAMLRVIRDLLAIKQQYSPAELQKPFVVPHVDFSPDYTDPEVRKMVMEHGLRATADLFGGAAAPQQLQGPAQHQAFGGNELFEADDEDYPDEDDMDEPDGNGVQNVIEQQYEQHVDNNKKQDPEICCSYDGCDKVLSTAEINYSLAYYDTFYCIKHQKCVKKVTQ